MSNVGSVGSVGSAGGVSGQQQTQYEPLTEEQLRFQLQLFTADGFEAMPSQLPLGGGQVSLPARLSGPASPFRGEGRDKRRKGCCCS